jgi:biopolymer transport protein TolR
MSQINVTPLVDVMLVLLIIFMLTAPMMQTGIDVKLPQIEAANIKTSEEPIIITIKKDGSIHINKNEVKLDKLETKLKAVFKRRTDDTLLLRADAEVSYGRVAETMAKIRKAGIQKISMITEPVTDKKRR